MGVKRIFPRVYDGAEKLRIVCDAVEMYAFECDRIFTSSELSEFIIRTRGVYISPPAIGAVLKRLKHIERIGDGEYVIRREV